MTIQLPRGRSRRAEKAPVAPGSGPSPDPTEPGGTELPLPHERDQSTGQTEPEPTDVMRQAKADIDNGLVDTDLRATPGLDAERRDELLKRERRRSKP